MFITIKNQQRKIPIDTDWLRAVVEVMLETLGYTNFSVGIMLVNNERMRLLNRTYRGKDAATDILSFPFHEDLKAGDIVPVGEDGIADLGDMILAPQFIETDAPVRWDRLFDEHLVALCAHGIAHLLQYDHQTDEDFEIMQRVEQKLISAVEQKRLIEHGKKRSPKTE